MQVDGFPVRVVAGVERASVGVEFVGEDEGVFGAAVGEGEAGAGPVGGVVVDETEVADAGDLYYDTKLEMNGWKVGEYEGPYLSGTVGHRYYVDRVGCEFLQGPASDRIASTA